MPLRLLSRMKLPAWLAPVRRRGSHRRSGAGRAAAAGQARRAPSAEPGTGASRWGTGAPGQADGFAGGAAAGNGSVGARGPVVAGGPRGGSGPAGTAASAGPVAIGPPAVVAAPGRGQSATARAQSGAVGAARAAIRTRDGAAVQRRPARSANRAATRAWYETRQASKTAAGVQDCGCLEPIVHREWAAGTLPAPATVTAIRRLAELPQLIKEKLAAGLEAIHVGAGGVPDLDDMGALRGTPLPSGRATWDACAGAYGDRKIVVGSRPSPTPDVMCHEIGHALDDIDGVGGQWQSDQADFCRLYQRCLPHMASHFHRQGGPLCRREFFADAFAAIASGQRPALVDMLAGDTRAALDVMLYFNIRYGI